ncbi:MAG: potassium-transporting ATPase subunit KdpA [Gammaproteobacteria bacterium]|nr:potassium-transporting ATPase subunit KdpA [Gammaproteobacteria bacterium]
MTPHDWLVIGVYVALVVAITKPMGLYIEQVMEGRLPFLTRIEGAVCRACGCNPEREQDWREYALSVLLVSLLGAVGVYALQRLQAFLPLNPQNMANVTADSAFDTAVSFVTNTNWQGYGGETTMSYLTQMLGLAVQNFLSAATGIAVAIALVRGFARRSSVTIGNFWLDLTRATLFLLLPLSLLIALVSMQQGVIQNFDAYEEVATLEPTSYQNPRVDDAGQPVKDAQGNPVTDPAASATQTLPGGPLASQLAIKMVGTNGGGFLNANSAHPYENPTPLSNLVEMLAIFAIGAGLTYTFGRMVGDTRQGWTLFAAMLIVFAVMAVAAVHFEQRGNPAFVKLDVDQSASLLQPGGNMEGKEARFGIADSGLFAAITTSASCGAVNGMHDSFTPLGGLVPLFLMQLGEVVFGGVGTGLYTMLIFAVLAVFIAGLMIGRTPEYLGKKFEAYDIKMTSIAILVTPALVLVGAALAVATDAGRAGVLNPGAHGFSEILYAYTSAGNNNGSAFAGLSANTPYYNVTLAIAMWFGRFAMIVPILAIAGSLAAKKRIPVGAGTMPTHGPLFVVLLIGTVLLVGALNYFPADALGPIVEHLMMTAAP